MSKLTSTLLKNVHNSADFHEHATVQAVDSSPIFKNEDRKRSFLMKNHPLIQVPNAILSMVLSYSSIHTNIQINMVVSKRFCKVIHEHHRLVFENTTLVWGTSPNYVKVGPDEVEFKKKRIKTPCQTFEWFRKNIHLFQSCKNSRFESLQFPASEDGSKLQQALCSSKEIGFTFFDDDQDTTSCVFPNATKIIVLDSVTLNQFESSAFPKLEKIRLFGEQFEERMKWGYDKVHTLESWVTTEYDKNLSHEKVKPFTNVNKVSLKYCDTWHKVQPFPLPRCRSLEVFHPLMISKVTNFDKIGSEILAVEVGLTLYLKKNGFETDELSEWKNAIGLLCDGNVFSNLREVRVCFGVRVSNLSDTELEVLLRLFLEFEDGVRMDGKCTMLFEVTSQDGRVEEIMTSLVRECRAFRGCLCVCV